jgi:hypothetical protein
MVPYVLLGIAILVLVYGLGRWFSTANPSSLAKWVKWGLIGIGTVGTIFLGVTGKVQLAFIPLAIAALPWLMSRMAARGNPNPTPGSQTDAETPYLRMTLDHDTGAMTGVVLQGRYEGRGLDELSEPQLLDLLDECNARDEQGARLLETYLDRTLGEEWRTRAEEPDEPHTEAPGAGGQKGWGRKRSARSPMTRQEAYEVLGLESGASTDEIKEAHRALMLKLHPDQGGSNYLAAKINQAKDLLLGS